MHVLQPHNKCINGNESKLLIILSPQCESDMGKHRPYYLDGPYEEEPSITLSI